MFVMRLSSMASPRVDTAFSHCHDKMDKGAGPVAEDKELPRLFLPVLMANELAGEQQDCLPLAWSRNVATLVLRDYGGFDHAALQEMPSSLKLCKVVLVKDGISTRLTVRTIEKNGATPRFCPMTASLL